MHALDLLLDFAGDNPIGLCLGAAILIAVGACILMSVCDATGERGRG